MILTEENASVLSSAMADLRDIPLSEMPALDPIFLDEAIGHAVPGSAVDAVPVAAFQSAV